MRNSKLAMSTWLAFVGLASGQTFDWTNTNGGTFSAAGNWSPAGGPPGVNATARFQLGTPINVNFTTNATVSGFAVNQGDVTFNLNGFNFQSTTLINSNGIGAANQTAALHLVNGTFTPAVFDVGGLNSHGTLTLQQASTMNVGAFTIGGNGQGTLSVQGFSSITTNGIATLGNNTTGIGTATIFGSGSSWTVNNTLTVGGSGNGTARILNGGLLNVSALNIGAADNGVGLLSASGANTSVTSAGTVNVGGTPALGTAASATLNIGTGATVSFNGTTNLRTTATVNQTGGTWNLNTLNITSGATINWTGGTVQLANASSITSPMLDVFLAWTHTLGTGRALNASSGTFNQDMALQVNGGTLIVPIHNVNAPLSIGAFGIVKASDTANLGLGQTVQIADFGEWNATNGVFNNGGTLQLNGPASKVTGFVQNLSGIIQGTGRLAGGMNNGTGGTIRARLGDHLIVDQVGSTNLGNIELSGGTLEYTHTLSNLANGSISGRGEFRGGTSNPGSAGISNLGVMMFSGGNTDIRGDVLNSSSGHIVTAGGGMTTFYDDVTHNGVEIRTNSGSRTVFFGAQSGAGAFTGTGTVEYNGDLRPGNSPANVIYEGSVEFSSSAHLHAELGGTVPGALYDRLSVSGTVVLSNPILDVEFLNGFTPSMGQSFMIIDNQSNQPIIGQFAGLSEGGTFTVNGTMFSASYLGGTGNDLTITSVPEPSSILLLCIVPAIAGYRLRRHSVQREVESKS